MADTKISDLAAVTDVIGTDEYVLARAGATKKIDASDLAAGLGSTAKLFDSTLGSDTASIDSGASSIGSGYAILEIWVLSRTTQAVDISSVVVRVNGDTGSNYDRETGRAASTGLTAAASLAQTGWSLPSPGSTQHAGAAGVIRLSIPAYASTTFHKTAEGLVAVPDDTDTSNHADFVALRWRSTSAITQVTVTAGSGSLLTGSRLLVYGR